jgi:hypothetical protein
MDSDEKKRERKRAINRKYRSSEEYKEKRRQYRIRHKEHITATLKAYRDAGKDKYTERNQRSFESFLRPMFSSLRCSDRKKKQEFNLDIDYLLGMLEAQEGRCAATGIKMTHNYGDPRAISIDRIDIKQGHIKGNIQLTCSFYNLGKRDRPESMARMVIQEIIQEARLRQLEELRPKEM